MLSFAWLIVSLPLLGFLFCAVLGRRAGRTVVAWFAPGVVLAAFAISIPVAQAVWAAPGHRAIVSMLPFGPANVPWLSLGPLRVNFAMLLDPLSLLMIFIVTGVGGLIHVYATGYMAHDPEQPRFFTYFNLFIFMMLLLVTGSSFLLMFVGWEGVGTCSYLLISFWYVDRNNARAGNKAFIVNRVGDVGFTLGILAVWSLFGTLDFATPNHHGVMDLARAHVDALGHPLAAGALTLVCVLLLIGALGKSAQIPLWIWLPDAMAGPTPVSALIHAATMVTAGVVMISRCSWLFVQAPAAMQIVGWIGLATAVLGATIGLVQNDIKKVLAYSTISQLGYMFLACGVGNFAGALFHVTTHAFFKALLFLGAGAVIHSMHGEQDMRKMGGLKKRLVSVWAVMFVGTYAIAGFPILSGFWSKDMILDSALRSPWGSGVVLYVVGLGTALMTAFYMNRLMWKTFYTEPRFEDGALVEHDHANRLVLEGTEAHHAEAHGTGHVHTPPASMMWPLYILATLSVVGGLALGPTGILQRFLAPSLAPLDAGPLRAAPEVLPGALTGYIISSIVAIAGLAIAAMLYQRNRASGQLVPADQEDAWAVKPTGIGVVYAFLFNRWYWDALYNAIFITAGGWFARNILWKTVDVEMIDGTVNGAARGVKGISRLIGKVQTGYVRNYALEMMMGMVALLVSFLVLWYRL
ncbi:MAG: NADH-quinone oxidoreductase subunit L [Armatimonadetes bacterium]|nr:NADH-quinone oxidoreductase subunit L [Armatimonadota bacterium]MDE2206728.1 NADH-quinone oxidoreductase subunit L [Armatimonadota bacterium]